MPAHASPRSRSAGYSLIEMVVVVVVLVAVLSSVVALIVATRPRLKRAGAGAREIIAARRASELLTRDIRAAGSARARGGSLVLTRGRDRVTWLLRNGKLVRHSGGRERAFAPRVASMRVSATGGFVEVGIGLPKTRRTRARCVYVGARLRAAEAPR